MITIRFTITGLAFHLVFVAGFVLSGCKTATLFNGIRSFIASKDEQSFTNKDNGYLHHNIPLLLDSIFKIIDSRGLKCFTIIVDRNDHMTDFIHKIVTRIRIPVFTLVLLSEEDTHYGDKVKYDFDFKSIIKNAVNHGCSVNVVWVEFETTAMKIAYLLTEGAKLSFNRIRSSYIFIPHLTDEDDEFTGDSTEENSKPALKSHTMSIKIPPQQNRILNQKTGNGSESSKDLIHWVKDVNIAREGTDANLKSPLKKHAKPNKIPPDHNKEKFHFSHKMRNDSESPDDVINCVKDFNIKSKLNSAVSVLCLQEMDSIPEAIALRKTNSRNNSGLNIEVLSNTFTNRYPNISLRVMCTWDGTGFDPEDCDPFPDKLSNLRGRHLRISTFSWYFPYISMKFLDGTENKLIMELARRLNFTYTFKINHEWGTIHPDGEGRGIHSDVVYGDCDVGVGGIFRVYQYTSYFDFTMAYLLNGITMLVPRPKPLQLWQSIYTPFKLTVWLMVITTVFAGSVALYLCALALRRQDFRSSDVHFYADFKNCLLTVIGQLTQEPVTWPSEAPLRHLLTWQFIFFVLLTTGYKSSLIYSLKYPRYEEPVNNAEEFTLKTNLYWTAVDESWPNLVASYADESLKKINLKYKRFANAAVLNKAVHDGNLAIAVEKLATGGYSGADYIDQEYISSSMWLMKTELSTTMVAIEFKRGSPYISLFDNIIHRLIQAGLIRQWERLSWLYTERWRKQLKESTIQEFGKRNKASAEPLVKMKMSHYHGVFMLLFFGLILAFVVLLIEIRWVKN